MDYHKRYTVFVDGAEVNDHYLTIEQALELQMAYVDDGYDPYVHLVQFDSKGKVKDYIHLPTEVDVVYEEE